MIAKLGRALPLGLIILGLGVACLVVAVVLEHYDLHRAQWYVGEAGMFALTLGALMAFFGALCQLLQGDHTGADGGRRNGG